jgi:hypothetical protein
MKKTELTHRVQGNLKKLKNWSQSNKIPLRDSPAKQVLPPITPSKNERVIPAISL